MAKDPPFDLDPHLAIRDPDALPSLLVSAMYDVLQRRQSGNMEERYIKAFNIAAWSLTTAGRKKTKHAGWTNEGSKARLKKGTLELTSLGVKKEIAARKHPDADAKKLAIKRMAKRIFDARPDYYAQSWQEAHSG